ncbi:DUF444 family protein [Desulfogranum japonicum]|uniref:DUF444 family protein n=1 Tax=Desulfogranum japonicum TaxID=231447 RepID=UPI0003F51DA9|nr:DUF444 family protein [Desulfogranum japonicum]
MKKMLQLYADAREKGLTAEQESKIQCEIRLAEQEAAGRQSHAFLPSHKPARSLYEYTDLLHLQGDNEGGSLAFASVHSLEYLLERDALREKDGFPRKIRIGKIVKPGNDGDNKIVVVPTTVEEKFIHDNIRQQQEGEGSGEGEGDQDGEGGAGDGEEGEVIGEQPVHEQQGGAGGAGQGEGGNHEIESNAYELGRVLTEQFRLPNLKEKGKKRSLTRYVYDLTDKNRGFGQVLDKKATMRRLIQTNISLKRITPEKPIDAENLLISPRDRVYRILSKEKDFESQAVVFFVRDYSGSMGGSPTELVVNQHVLLYSWLIYQYENQVETRFILHDLEAKEVEDFYTYYNLQVAGGTQVSSAYALVNEIVEKEQLERDYNIYIFHGTDGDDWDTKGEKALPELRKMLSYASRVGITIAENNYSTTGRSEVETYLRKSGLLEEKGDLLRLDVLKRDSNEGRLIEGIRALIS